MEDVLACLLVFWAGAVVGMLFTALCVAAKRGDGG